MTPTRRYYANGAPTLTTSGSITSGATSVTVATNFTGYPTQFPYYACLDKGTVSQEIVLVTNVVGSVATITRGQDGTLGVSHPAGATVDFVAVAKDFDEANAHTSATAGVHGVAGNVVGDTDVQTMSNKTFTNPIVTGTLAAFGPAWSSYTPTLTAVTTNPTLGTGNVRVGRYIQIGKTVLVYVLIKFGTSGTNAGSGAYIVSLPVAGEIINSIGPAGADGTYRSIGTGQVQANGLHTPVYVSPGGTNGNNVHYFSAATGGSIVDLGSGNPGGWTANDYIMLNLAYEVA